MLGTLSRPALTLLLLAPYTFAQQQAGENTWARYRLGKLSSTIKAHTNPAVARDEGVDLGSDSVRARVIYTGASRPTLEAKQRFIAFYMESQGTPELAKKFMTEMLFIEDGLEFWLPVQGVLIPYFEKELHKGESVTVFANWIGITSPDRGGSRLHIFLVNEFERSDQWRTVTGPDKDFTVDFPAQPERDEFRGNPIMGKAGRLTRRYFAFKGTMALFISFQDLDYAPNTPFADRVSPSYERKIREVARRDGWKIIRIRRLSDSVVETEAWTRSADRAGYVHTISRLVVRSGQAYELECSSVPTGREVDRAVCRRFFDSFRIIGPPQ